MSTEEKKESEEFKDIPKRGRGRPQLNDDQRIARDKQRYEKQHAYYLANRDRINNHQKEAKNTKYKEDPDFRQKAIDYISAYNKRRTAICHFVEAWPDKEFQDKLKRFLAERL
jgi:hypothetical protein